MVQPSNCYTTLPEIHEAEIAEKQNAQILVFIFGWASWITVPKNAYKKFTDAVNI